MVGGNAYSQRCVPRLIQPEKARLLNQSAKGPLVTAGGVRDILGSFGATTGERRHRAQGRERGGSLPGDGPHLHVLAEEERAHVRRGRRGVRLQQLAGGHGLVAALLAFPVLQQGLERVQAVVHSPGAQQGGGRGARDEGGRLRRSREKARMAGRPECTPAEPESRNALTTL